MSSPDDTMSSSDNGSSPADIITYIGVPLAVLGVMPILYNTARTLITLSNVKRLLRKSRLAGITRGDVVNHVIEVELPRFSIAPVDREYQSDEYWHIYEHPSLVQGGSWTIFNWKAHTIGIKTQRIEYSDQLRQPQAEIGFEQLVSYLMDLGAVPNPTGFKMLRSTGLWVPVGTPLLLSPNREESVLSIAPLDDSDGHLSLAVKWSRTWKVRDKTALPPYWIRIMGPPKLLPMKKSEADEESSPEVEESSVSLRDPFEADADAVIGKSHADQKREESSAIQNDTKSSSIRSKSVSISSFQSAKKSTEEVEGEFVRCHISIEGIVDAMTEDTVLGPLEHFDINHLKIMKSNSSTTGVWFASAATALGSNSHGALWNYHIPEDILSFAKKDTIPCGVLVMLGIVDESKTPEWATKYDDADEIREAQFRRMREQTRATQIENKLPPDQKIIAIRNRQQKTAEDWMEQMRADRRKETQRAEQKMLEALQSAKWDSKLVGEHNLKWLKQKGLVHESHDVRRAVEVVLYRMLAELDLATDLRQMLDSWKSWVDEGGMRKADFQIAKEHQESFAYASLFLAVLRSSVTAAEGSVAMDLQESVRIWKMVRLG